MSKITVRFSDEEDAVLRTKAEAMEVSVSEFVRLHLFPDGADADGGPATAGQVRLIEGRLDALVEEVGRLRKTVEHGAVPPVEKVGILHRPSVICTPVLEPESRREMAVIVAALRDIYGCLQDKMEKGAGGESCQVAVQKVLTEVRESKRVADHMVESLERFCKEKLPNEVEKVTKYLVQGIVSDCFKPLMASVQTSARDMDEHRARLNRMSWGWRLLLGPVASALVISLVAAAICHHLLFDSGMATMRRYAEWGQMIELRLNKLPPKEHEKVLRMIGLRP